MAHDPATLADKLIEAVLRHNAPSFGIDVDAVCRAKRKRRPFCVVT
jgi:hypothetical protein